MAKLTEVVVARSVKVNLGDYQSIDFFASAKVENFTGQDNRLAVIDDTGRRLEDALAAQILASYKTRGKKATLEQIKRRYGLTGVANTDEEDFG